MTPALAPIAPKIAALLPRLASEHEGEVIATARAVQRVLSSVGADLHDLAAALQSHAAIPRSPQVKTAKPPRWRDLTPAARERWLHFVLSDDSRSAWETSFLASVLERHRRAPMTFKQQAVLDRLIEQTWEGVEW